MSILAAGSSASSTTMSMKPLLSLIVVAAHDEDPLMEKPLSGIELFSQHSLDSLRNNSFVAFWT